MNRKKFGGVCQVREDTPHDCLDSRDPGGARLRGLDAPCLLSATGLVGAFITATGGTLVLVVLLIKR